MNLADRLKRARESLGYTQKKIASFVSVSVQMWRAYEAGSSVPGGNVFEGLARLGLNVNWLLTGEGDMKRGEDRAYNSSVLNKELLLRVIEALLSLPNKDKTPEEPKQTAQNLIFFYDLLNVRYNEKEMTVENIKYFISAFSDLAEVAVKHDFATKPDTLEMILQAMMEGGLYPGIKKKES
jgi:transcriptional regulator with XRE-family HTH domain